MGGYRNFGGGGFGGGFNMQQLMKQAQKMQEDMEKAKQELNETKFSAKAGGGMVEAVLTGEKKIVSLTIKQEIVDPDDVEMLADLILSAVNEAIRQSDDMANSEMSKITGGMGNGLF